MNFALTRKLIIFGLVLPLAAVIGFSLATPNESKTFILMVAVTSLLLLPVMLKWYHPLLIFSLNAWINIYFLPGNPQLWMLFSAVGLGIAVLNSALEREKGFIHVPALTLPLLFFLSVVLITAKLTGGIGTRALGGGGFGGKGYFAIIFATMAYFALASQPIPLERAKTYISMFFLSGLTGVLGNVAYTLGPAFYFLFYLFPVDFVMSQAMFDFSVDATMRRIGGLSVAGAALYFFMLARYGIRGILDLRHLWRLPLFVASVGISLMGGFRSLLLSYVVHFVIQFYLERLVRTRLCLFLLVMGITGGALLLPFLDKLPLPVQRCVALIPGAPVSTLARVDAEGTTKWRLEMWQVVATQIPRYLILGKGYAYDPADLYLASQAEKRGIAKNYEAFIVAGSYHNGPLSLIIPFGIFGTLGFLWLIGAGCWVLYRNYRYGDPTLRLINIFLLAYYIMRLLIFLLVFGALESDLHRFLGTLGLSVAINRGVRKPAESPVREAVGLKLQPA